MTFVLWLLLRLFSLVFNSLTTMFTVAEAGNRMGEEEHIGLFNSINNALVLRLGCGFIDVYFYHAS